MGGNRAAPGIVVLGNPCELHERLREAEQRLTELREQAARARRRMVSKAEVDSALEAFTPLWDMLIPREQARTAVP